MRRSGNFSTRCIQSLWFSCRTNSGVSVLVDVIRVRFTLTADYVVQSVITVGSEDDRSKVVNRLKGQMFPSQFTVPFSRRLLTSVSRHKFASNVCEKALVHCQPQDRRDLVDELIGIKSDGTTNIPTLLRDAFGNFPLQVSRRSCGMSEALTRQTALMCTEDDQRVKVSQRQTEPSRTLMPAP